MIRNIRDYLVKRIDFSFVYRTIYSGRMEQLRNHPYRSMVNLERRSQVRSGEVRGDLRGLFHV